MTPVIADYGLGEALVTVLGIFFVFLWLWVLITIISDVFRDQELSGGWKALWLFLLIFLPFITAFVYLIARGKGMRERAIQHQADMQKAAETYIKDVAGASPADELAKLNDLLKQGAISQEEFERMKSKIVG